MPNTLRRLSPKPHVLVRVRDDGATYTVDAPTERKARTAMFHSLVINLDMPARAANTAADAIEIGEPATHGRYTFTLTPRASA